MCIATSFKNHLDLLSPECAKRSEKKQKYITHKTFMKTHIVQQTKHQLQCNISRQLIFKIEGIEWELSMMRISYKLKNRTTKTYYIINFNSLTRKCITSLILRPFAI